MLPVAWTPSWWRDGRWMLAAFLGLGLLTWAGFLYIGGRAKRAAWRRAAALYGLGAIVVLVLMATTPQEVVDGESRSVEGAWQSTVGIILVLAMWAGGSVHALLANQEWLAWLVVNRPVVGPYGSYGPYPYGPHPGSPVPTQPYPYPVLPAAVLLPPAPAAALPSGPAVAGPLPTGPPPMVSPGRPGLVPFPYVIGPGGRLLARRDQPAGGLVPFPYVVGPRGRLVAPAPPFGAVPSGWEEPWVGFVRRADSLGQRFRAAAARVPPGPVQGTVVGLVERVDRSVVQVREIAAGGQALATARRGLDLPGIEAALAATRAEDDGADERDHQIAAALEGQHATAVRMDRQITDAVDQLRLIDARLGEALARVVELSVRPVASVQPLPIGVDTVVADLESLRQALDEVETLTPW